MDKRFIHRDGHLVYTSISSRAVGVARTEPSITSC